MISASFCCSFQLTENISPPGYNIGTFFFADCISWAILFKFHFTFRFTVSSLFGAVLLPNGQHTPHGHLELPVVSHPAFKYNAFFFQGDPIYAFPSISGTSSHFSPNFNTQTGECVLHMLRLQSSSRKQFPPNLNHTEGPGPLQSHQQMLQGVNWQKLLGRTKSAAFGSLFTSKLTSLAKKRIRY